MSDYFTNLYSRSFDLPGDNPKVSPRLPSLFEPIIETFNGFTTEDFNHFEMNTPHDDIITNIPNNTYVIPGPLSNPKKNAVKQPAINSDHSDDVCHFPKQTTKVAQSEKKVSTVPDSTSEHLWNEQSENIPELRSAHQIFRVTQEEPHLSKNETMLPETSMQNQISKYDKKNSLQLQPIKPEKDDQKQDILSKTEPTSKVQNYQHEKQTNIRNNVQIHLRKSDEVVDMPKRMNIDHENKSAVREVVNSISPATKPVLNIVPHFMLEKKTDSLSSGTTSAGSGPSQVSLGQSSNIHQSNSVRTDQEHFSPRENINKKDDTIVAIERVAKLVETNSSLKEKIQNFDNRTSGDIIKPAISHSIPDFRTERNAIRSVDVRHEESTIQVTIGRIEIRAGSPPVQSRPKSKSVAPMSLEEYFKKRNGGI